MPLAFPVAFNMVVVEHNQIKKNPIYSALKKKEDDIKLSGRTSESSQDDKENLDEETKGGDNKKEIVLMKMETDIVKMTAKVPIYYYALKLPKGWMFLR